jgi:hypothetical protein
MTQEKMIKAERTATGLYVVAARDASDFLEMLGEEQDPEVLGFLYQMFASWNPNMLEDHRKLNATLAPSVGRRLDKLGIPRPQIIEEPTKPARASIIQCSGVSDSMKC